MSVGFPMDKPSIDARVGSLVIQLREALDGAQRIKVVLDSLPDADLIAKGYTQGEVNTLKSAFSALNTYALLGRGQATQPAASDFFFDAKKLTGLN